MVTSTQAIGARIATLGLSQRKLASMLGVSQAALNGWLNGYTRPPARFLERATEVLDVMEEVERAATAAREEVLARVREGTPIGSRATGHVEPRSSADPRDPDVLAEKLPDVLFVEEVAELLRCHPKTIKRRLDHHVFFRWRRFQASTAARVGSKAAVLQWLSTGGGHRKPARKGRRR